jgi:hypothetical protein
VGEIVLVLVLAKICDAAVEIGTMPIAMFDQTKHGGGNGISREYEYEYEYEHE